MVDGSIPSRLTIPVFAERFYFRNMPRMDADQKHVWKLKMLGIATGIMIVIPILAWKWGLL